MLTCRRRTCVAFIVCSISCCITIAKCLSCGVFHSIAHETQQCLSIHSVFTTKVRWWFQSFNVHYSVSEHRINMPCLALSSFLIITRYDICLRTKPASGLLEGAYDEHFKALKRRFQQMVSCKIARSDVARYTQGHGQTRRGDGIPENACCTCVNTKLNTIL